MSQSRVTGTCMSMCPVKEIQMREREKLLHPFEALERRTQGKARLQADISRCVKEYRRPTVGSQDVDPSDLRPPCVLVTTVDYLVNSVCTRPTSWPEIYDYVFDRLRAVRQDLVVQDVGGPETITVLETAVRFHLYSDYRLCIQPIAMFDQKINDQHTQECIKRLINLYNDARVRDRTNITSEAEATRHRIDKRVKSGQHDGRTSDVESVPGDIINSVDSSRHGAVAGNQGNVDVWENQAEFEAAYLLFNLGESDAIKHFYSLPAQYRKHPSVRLAYQLSCAYLTNNWVRVCKLIRRLASPVHLCAVHRHFTSLRRRALVTMNSGYSSKNLTFPMDKLTELLFLNTDTETQRLCLTYGIHIEGSVVRFSKSQALADVKVERSYCDYITSQLKQWTIPEIIQGVKHGDMCADFNAKCRT